MIWGPLNFTAPVTCRVKPERPTTAPTSVTLSPWLSWLPHHSLELLQHVHLGQAC